MAGVSPCFFAHFPWKNWVYPETALLPRRFQELVTLQPDLIQIISWNGKTTGDLAHQRLGRVALYWDSAE
jgi:Glycosyl hydrolase family 71